MCDKKSCKFISIIELNDEGEKIYIHYDKNWDCVFYQHYNPKTDLFREFEPKK
jgi:hypothetical protein